jgi:hypothetical protein
MSIMRPVRRLARGVLLLALAFTLMGNGGWACGPFGPGANGRIPDVDPDVIGKAADLNVTYSQATDLTVLSLRDVDPAAFVAMRWDRAR